MSEVAEPSSPSVLESLRSHLDGQRVLIVHDWLVAWAGAERCVEQMMRVFPSADLVVGVLSSKMRPHNALTRRAQETWLGRVPGAREHHRWFLPLEALAFATLDTTGYRLVISSSHAFSKAIRKGPETVHLCYCHSPPRYLWDLAQTYRADASLVQRFALSLGTRPLRAVDRWAARRVDRFVCNSRFVADRIRRIYRRDAEVIYPPVTAKPWSSEVGRREAFLLSLGRLVPYKRVDLAIAAAERLGVRLVVAGDGPDRARLERLGGRWTEFVGEVSEEEAGRLMSSCAAFVFCGEEDFGIAPVEANAHGVPVVGYGRGGLLETMREGDTAEFFREQTVDAIAAAIERTLARRWDEVALKQNASRFAPSRFRQALSTEVVRALEAHTSSGR